MNAETARSIGYVFGRGSVLAMEATLALEFVKRDAVAAYMDDAARLRQAVTYLERLANLAREFDEELIRHRALVDASIATYRKAADDLDIIASSP